MQMGKKLIVYSLAKTMWIFLTEISKGFDGQYSTDSVLDLKRYFPKNYTLPIDKLILTCTDNDPKKRPSVKEFINVLEGWKELNLNFHKRNLHQWSEIQKTLFPTAFPSKVIWENINDIIKILKILCIYDNLNHMFFPDGGGLDLEDVRIAPEEGCIELDFQLIDIVKPKRLLFESFNCDPFWNYFRLELDELKPALEKEETEVDKNENEFIPKSKNISDFLVNFHQHHTSQVTS